MKKVVSSLSIITTIILVLVIDLVTKHFLFSVDYFNIIPNIISIKRLPGGNTGMAWGLFSNKTVGLIVVSLIMVIALLIFNHFVKNKNIFYCISFGFIIGGALGNMYDRIFLNYVRDFLYFDFLPNFPIFNFADSFLCVGAIMLAIYILFMSNKKENN